MCPVCGTLLQLAESPQAQRERVFINRLIDEGKTEAEVKDALVAEYGDEVLALPPGSGFSLSAYLVPIVAFLIAVAALAVGVLRWRRAGATPRTVRRREPAGRATRTPSASTPTWPATTSEQPRSLWARTNAHDRPSTATAQAGRSDRGPQPATGRPFRLIRR